MNARFISHLLLLSSLAVHTIFGGPQENTLKSAEVEFSPPYHFSPGDRFFFDVTLRSASQADFTVLRGGAGTSGSRQPRVTGDLPHTIVSSLKGKYILTVLSTGDDSAIVSFTLKSPAITFGVNGHEVPPIADALRDGLAKDIFAKVTMHGAVRAVLFDSSVQSTAQQYARKLIAITQFLLPHDQAPGYGAWETQEEDPGGVYIAQYKRVFVKGKESDDSPLKSFQKRKVHYVREREQPTARYAEISQMIVPGGSLIGRFDFSNGVLNTLHGTESEDTFIGKKKLAHATITIQLSYSLKQTVPSRELDSMRIVFATRERTGPFVPLSARRSLKDGEARTHVQELGAASLDSLLADLQNIEREKNPGPNTTRLYLKFKAFVYLHPESCETLGNILRTVGSRSVAMNILPQALSSVGHDHAQTVLIEAIKARADDKTALVSLIPALSNVPVATPEAEEALWDLALRSDDHEISSMARLALGSQAQRIAVADSERANRIVQRFLEELRSTRSDETTELILLALGNAGQALSVTAISRYAADSSAHLRAVAMHSLRFVKSSEAEAILINALKSDPESLVRVAAVEAFEYRELTAASFAAQEAALSRDTTVALRLKVLENLWRAHDRSPQVVALVRRVASVDPNRQVRTTAAGLMKDYDSSRLR